MATKERNTSRRRTAPHKAQPKPAEKRTSPEVVYLPPKPFSRSRLALHLITGVAVVLALLVGVSLFFRVETVLVSGNVQYSAWDIQEAAGISQGDGLLTLNSARISGRITTALPYVEQVRVGIKLPDTVYLEIVEIEVTYAVRDASQNWWLVSSEGKVTAKAADGAEASHTKLLGVQISDPQVGAQAVALESGADATDETGVVIPVTVSQAQYLQTALDIAGYLELNGLIGTVASIDVSNLGDIQLWYGTQYQVVLGENTQLSYKISCLKAVLDKMEDYQSGVLDISFTTWPDQVGYTPFD